MALVAVLVRAMSASERELTCWQIGSLAVRRKKCIYNNNSNKTVLVAAGRGSVVRRRYAGTG